MTRQTKLKRLIRVRINQSDTIPTKHEFMHSDAILGGIRVDVLNVIEMYSTMFNYNLN